MLGSTVLRQLTLPATYALLLSLFLMSYPVMVRWESDLRCGFEAVVHHEDWMTILSQCLFDAFINRNTFFDNRIVRHVSQTTEGNDFHFFLFFNAVNDLV